MHRIINTLCYTCLQLSSTKPSYDRQRSDSGRSVDSETDRQREKTPEYADDFSSEPKPSKESVVSENKNATKKSAIPVGYYPQIYQC